MNKLTEVLCFWEKNVSRGLSAPALGLYTCIWPLFLNIFSESETALPMKAKFYVEPPWEGVTWICKNALGHMTKKAAMPIYGQNH